MIDHLHGTSFSWFGHAGGSLADLGIPTREPFIVASRAAIRCAAVGWCAGEELVWEPKIGHVGLMLEVAGRRFWTHITYREFAAVFPEEVRP